MLATRDGKLVFRVLHTHFRPVLMIGVMTAAAYSLVFRAFQVAPISYAGARARGRHRLGSPGGRAPPGRALRAHSHRGGRARVRRHRVADADEVRCARPSSLPYRARPRIERRTARADLPDYLRRQDSLRLPRAARAREAGLVAAVTITRDLQALIEMAVEFAMDEPIEQLKATIDGRMKSINAMTACVTEQLEAIKERLEGLEADISDIRTDISELRDGEAQAR